MPLPEFTSHNILLPDGSQTRPGWPLISETGICQATLRDLKLAFPWKQWMGSGMRPTVADLGCLEGGYAAEFARAGYDVTGAEIHPDNLACCRHVAGQLKLPNLHFVEADVRKYLADVAAIGAGYDAVFCCGLLYHLDKPVEFVHLLGKVTTRLLILQTHYSVSYGEQNEGYRGHWFGEQPGTRWSSHDNPRSFWLGKTELLSVMADAGFAVVYEQFDYLTSIRQGKYIDQHHAADPDRGMFVGIKT